MSTNVSAIIPVSAVAELALKEAEGWPVAPWRPQMTSLGPGSPPEWIGAFDVVDSEGDAQELDATPESDYANEFARFVVSMVERTPILARAVLDLTARLATADECTGYVAGIVAGGIAAEFEEARAEIARLKMRLEIAERHGKVQT